MIRLCLIGNSHTAALKQGWELVKGNFPNVALTVFAASGMNIDALRPRRNMLVPETPQVRKSFKRTSGVAGRIDSRSYDRFLVCASQFNANFLGRFLVRARLDTEPKDERQPLSWSLFLRVAEANYRSAFAAVVVEKLRRATGKPVAIISQPLFSDHARWPNSKAILGADTPQRLADCFATAARAITSSLNSEIFFQPDFTKSSPLRTKRDYSKGSMRFCNEGRGPEDISHMNAEYGAIIWREIMADPAWSGAVNMDGAQTPGDMRRPQP